MNYFTTAVLAGTLVTLIVGVLLGLLRGMRRSVLRLALLVLCLVLALAICPAVSETVMNVKISDGKTLETLLTENFSNGGEPLSTLLSRLLRFWQSSSLSSCCSAFCSLSPGSSCSLF